MTKFHRFRAAEQWLHLLSRPPRSADASVFRVPGPKGARRPEEAFALEPSNLAGKVFDLREDQTKNRTPGQFRPAAEAAGLDGLRPYDLRHAAASLKIRAGGPLPDVAADLGHSFDTLARVYAGEIKAMRGEPTMPVAEAIRAARRRNGVR